MILEDLVDAAAVEEVVLHREVVDHVHLGVHLRILLSLRASRRHVIH